MVFTSTSPIYYRTCNVNGVEVFYREAGPVDAPTLLLLHGLPTSSRMFDPLFLRLAGKFRLIAPDYPGFGHSAAPSPEQFTYTFEHIAEIMALFVKQIGLEHYSLYMQDYGGPVGFNMALRDASKLRSLIIQNSVFHESALGEMWNPRRAYWVDRAAHEDAVQKSLLSFEATRGRHIGNDPNVARYSPDLWTDELCFLHGPGEAAIQSALVYDYKNNVASYPEWQAWLKQCALPLLVLWGKYDTSFEGTEPEAIKREIPSAELHVLDAGHFALDTAPDEIADLVSSFLERLEL